MKNHLDSFKIILRNPQATTNDPILIAAMMHCAKNVHDTLGFVCLF